MSSPIQPHSEGDGGSAAPAATAPAYPQLRLNSDALENNIRVMASWCRERHVDLVPHVKTTMSAPIIARQVAAGAVGVTVATVDQAASALVWGHRHVLIANQVVDRLGLTRLRSWLEEDSGREIRCFVDSAAGVGAAAQVFDAEAGAALEVLLDVGTPGGRTGIRSLQEAVRIAELVRAAPGLRLVGVAGYEGVVPNSRAEETIAAVDRHCRLVRDVYLEVARFYETPAPIYSMGGSAFPDRVAEYLPDDGPGARNTEDPPIRLLRHPRSRHVRQRQPRARPPSGADSPCRCAVHPRRRDGRRRRRQAGSSLRRRAAGGPVGTGPLTAHRRTAQPLLCAISSTITRSSPE